MNWLFSPSTDLLQWLMTKVAVRCSFLLCFAPLPSTPPKLLLLCHRLAANRVNTPTDNHSGCEVPDLCKGVLAHFQLHRSALQMGGRCCWEDHCFSELAQKTELRYLCQKKVVGWDCGASGPLTECGTPGKAPALSHEGVTTVNSDQNQASLIRKGKGMPL